MFTSVLPGILDLGGPGAPWMVRLDHFDGSTGIPTETTTDWVYSLFSGRFQWPLYHQVNNPIKPCLRRVHQIFGSGAPGGPLDGLCWSVGWFHRNPH